MRNFINSHINLEYHHTINYEDNPLILKFDIHTLYLTDWLIDDLWRNMEILERIQEFSLRRTHKPTHTHNVNLRWTLFDNSKEEQFRNLQLNFLFLQILHETWHSLITAHGNTLRFIAWPHPHTEKAHSINAHSIKCKCASVEIDILHISARDDMKLFFFT
jgi:hypothetical protein